MLHIYSGKEFDVSMQKVSVRNLRQGMTTYTQLRAADGRILLGSKIELNERYISRIQELGIFSLSVTNPIIERLGLVYEETLSEEHKAKVTKNLKSAFDDIKKGELIDVYRISALAKIIEDTVRKNQIIRINNCNTVEDYIYSHSVNVAALVAVIASDMDYSTLKIHELVMGALLHDVGKVFEGDNVKEHCQRGFDYVRKLRGLSVLSMHVILDHHEKYDGTGYPRQLSGSEIPEYAKIAAIANAYDAMVSDPQREELLLPHQAYEALMSMSGTYFDREITNIFLAKAPLYPVGTFVVLDSGYIGVITETLPKLQSRPSIMVLSDEHGVLTDNWQEINLADNLTTFIMRVMSEEEVIELTNKYERKQ